MFKHAVVQPLLKKSTLDHNNLKNYRPVSNLSFLSKVTEKLVLRQLFPYLNFHDLLRPSQSAYHPRHSTEMAQLKMTNNILLALDSGDMSDSGAPFWICPLLSTLLTTIFSSTDFNLSMAFLALFFLGSSLISLAGLRQTVNVRV